MERCLSSSPVVDKFYAIQDFIANVRSDSPVGSSLFPCSKSQSGTTTFRTVAYTVSY